MHRHALEQALGPHRPKACHSDRSIRSLPLHVLFCAIKDLLGTRLEVRIPVSDIENAWANQVSSRSLNGALNGNIGVMKSVLAEMTDQTNLAVAYSYEPIAWSVGTTLG